MSKYTTFQLKIDGPVARITLDRPEVRNAFDEVMIGELSTVCDELSANDDVRVVVLTGAGKVFCAGADLNWMKKVAKYTYEQNLEDARVFAKMMEKLYRMPKATIAMINGPCMGGGVGLAGTCDIVVASRTEAVFALREILLGIAPATISPYVLRKIGERYAHDYFLTGRKFDAERAYEMGLVDDVASPEELEDHVAQWIQRFLHAGPEALRATKELINRVAWSPIEEVQDYMAEMIAKLRGSDEGQEGFNAFFEKRKPKWDVEL